MKTRGTTLMKHVVLCLEQSGIWLIEHFCIYLSKTLNVRESFISPITNLQTRKLIFIPACEFSCLGWCLNACILFLFQMYIILTFQCSGFYSSTDIKVLVIFSLFLFWSKKCKIVWKNIWQYVYFVST